MVLHNHGKKVANLLLLCKAPGKKQLSEKYRKESSESCRIKINGYTSKRAQSRLNVFGSIVYNRAIIYIHQNFLNVVVHVIIIDQ